jgi:hypothetical protein
VATNTILRFSIFEVAAAFCVELYITDVFMEEFYVMYHIILAKM